jgi:DNA helicase-2/ATP-dependent DNA helicase PcrA
MSGPGAKNGNDDFDFSDVPTERASTPKNTFTPSYASPAYSQEITRPREISEGEILPYVESLNPKQKEAVLHTEGPLIVLAGAGSGKTKMLTSRIAYLMDVRGVPAQRILAVTFTNKAAREMRERVQKSLATLGGGHFFGQPEIGTFHAICVRILRRELQATPFTKPFTIYDDSDQLSLIKRCLEKLSIDDKAFSPKAMQAAINRLKCDAMGPEDLEAAPHDIFEKQLKRVYEQYQKDLFSNNALDFGEIICMTYRILRDNQALRAQYQNRFAYIHVDEYQDTNRAQYLLLSVLAKSEYGGHQNICVVGDEDQSIYKWRGADIRNILDFESDYPGAYVVKLEQNYRSTQTIIAAASQVIRNNKERKDKTLWTENEAGPKIIRAALADERAEAEYVISELKRIASNEELSFKEFAIFYRTHAQSRQFEESLRREKIPYEIVGGLRFYDRKEIKDILSYFKALQNPQDSVSLKRIINTPARGIGKTTIDKLEDLQLKLEQEMARAAAGVPTASVGTQLGLEEGDVSSSTDTSLWKALEMATLDPKLTSSGTAKKLSAFYALMLQLMRNQKTQLLSELYHVILDETGYVRELRAEGTDEAQARIENLEEFDTVLQEFEETQLEGLDDDAIALKRPELLSIFLEESSLANEPPAGSSAAAAGQEHQGNVVQMMSLHSSKGLEYPVVFLVGMEEGLFPSIRGFEAASDEDIEEERRLCYVGITRARERLYMTHAGIRRIWGDVKYQEPARFFQEIPDELVEFKDLSFGASSSAYRTGSSRHFGGGGSDHFSQESAYDEDGNLKKRGTLGGVLAAGSKVGKKLEHPDYGAGKIIAQEGSGKDEKLTVQFTRGGNRKFLTRFVEGFIQ